MRRKGKGKEKGKGIGQLHNITASNVTESLNNTLVTNGTANDVALNASTVTVTETITVIQAGVPITTAAATTGGGVEGLNGANATDASVLSQATETGKKTKGGKPKEETASGDTSDRSPMPAKVAGVCTALKCN